MIDPTTAAKAAARNAIRGLHDMEHEELAEVCTIAGLGGGLPDPHNDADWDPYWAALDQLADRLDTIVEEL